MPPGTGQRGKKSKSGFYKYLLQILVILVCVAGIYILWLDLRIRREFEGNKWLLPARVFASPVEIYPEQTISVNSLKAYLLDLGYEQGPELIHAGQFQIHGNTIVLNTRPVEYWDGEEKSRSLRIEFQGSRILRIRDISSGGPVSILRLEPLLIGKIYPQHNEDRILVDIQAVPELLINALIAVEDRGFYLHHGIDLRGILRAFVNNLLQGKITQGGSTLTQQLVKNFFLTPDRTIRRKLNEMIMAMLLEIHYSKRQILSAYINEVYLGQHGARAIHGFGTASEFYFTRPLNELRSDQLALLAALVRGASFYNPRRHPERARARRDLVLDLLFQQGYISQYDSDIAKNRPLDVVEKPSWTNAKYPAFLDLVRRQLLQDYRIEDLQNEGLKIFTTLDAVIQANSEGNAGRRLAKLEKDYELPGGRLQMAAVIVRIATGDVLAIIGGRDRYTEGFNRALDARRPIGSLIKPSIYLTALASSRGFTLLSPVMDEKITISQDDGTVWEPRNYDRETHGEVYLYEALKNSYNLASVQLGMQIGLGEVINTIRKTGIDSEIGKYPSLLLGSVELSPLEVTQMYQTLANEGFQAPLNSITEVLDSHGRPLQRYGLEMKQTLDDGPVFLLNYILSQVVESGTARSLKSTMGNKLPLAGKTGTTNDLRDSWYAGFGDNLLAVTWLGYDNYQPSRFTGATGALQLWAAIMQSVDIQPLEYIAPEDIKWLSRKRGLFSLNCPELDRIPYIVGQRPEFRKTCYSE